MPVYGKARPAVSHRTSRSSSATEVIPALIASRWVSWSPAILRDSSVFGKSLLPGPCSSVFDVNSQSTYINTFLKSFLWGNCNLCPLFCLSACFGRKTVTTSLWKRNQKRQSWTTRKKKGNLAKILKSHIFRGFKIKTILSSKGYPGVFMCRLMVKRQTTSFHLVGTKHAAPLCKQTDFLKGSRLRWDHPSLDPQSHCPPVQSIPQLHLPATPDNPPILQPSNSSLILPELYLLLHFAKCPLDPMLSTCPFIKQQPKKKKERIICLLFVLLGKHLVY